MPWPAATSRSADQRLDPAGRQLGLYVFLASLAALFLATLAAVLITRLEARNWPSERLVPLRPTLFAATALLALTSAALEYARRGLKANRERALQSGLWVALGCALLFLSLQTRNFVRAWNAIDAFDNLYAFSFSLITGVHALHVIGGLVPLCWVMVRASRREYSSSRSQGVLFCAQYWHFLGLVWLVILAVLLAI